MPLTLKQKKAITSAVIAEHGIKLRKCRICNDRLYGTIIKWHKNHYGDQFLGICVGMYKGGAYPDPSVAIDCKTVHRSFDTRV